MRQAGRYLPEYQKIRSKYDDFMSLCNSVEDIVEVTLQPITRFDLDAAIIFSDILVIPQALGYKVEFKKNHGPQISGDIKDKEVNLSEKLKNCYQSINITRDKLAKKKALIGFSGAPWTLACYIFGKEKNYNDVKGLAYNKDKEFFEVFRVLTEKVYEHLRNQILNGADLVKIFDSWAGVLDSYHIEKLSFTPIKQIYHRLKEEFPATPIIIFSKDTATHNMGFNPDGLAFSYSENTELVLEKTDKDMCLQGNLDPIYLEIEDQDLVKNQVYKIMSSMKQRKHIFNLGHGINPRAKIENIEYVIDLVRGYKSE